MSDSIDKIKSRGELTALCEAFRREGKRIGFTSGVFDLLHAGHVEYLEKARALCDVLIVGVNSDASVKRYKGQNRPYVPEDLRVRVLAGLTSVDFVFIFSERRNEKNIRMLRPDFYIKAGDYSPEQLTSREIVEAAGGRVVLIPIQTKISTTEIVQKILQAERGAAEEIVEQEGAVHFRRRPLKPTPAVFLDRDGTINREVEYLHDPKKFELLPNALQGLKKVQDMGYRLVIVTNQGGIGLGYYTEEDFYRVNREMFRQLSDGGVKIDKIYFCPHNVTEGCRCRKPETGLLQQAVKDLNLDLAHSFMIGDKTIDLETGRRAGIRKILVKTGHAGADKVYSVQPDYTARDLLDAAEWILQTERREKS